MSNQSLTQREREAYEATVKLADATSPQEAIDYLKKVIAQPLPETKTVFNEVEINKINLQSGDVLLLKVKGPDFQNDEVCKSLQKSFKDIFPNNKIGVLYLEENSIDISVISQEHAELIQKRSDAIDSPQEKACNTENYCVDCNCGKKIKAENDLPKEE